MKTLKDHVKTIRSTQAKILSHLLNSPLYKMSLFINTNLNQLFNLNNEEESNLNIAWTLLKDEGVVYSEVHEIGIKTESLQFASRFVNVFNDEPVAA